MSLRGDMKEVIIGAVSVSTAEDRHLVGSVCRRVLV